jgi:hypothetical protein
MVNRNNIRVTGKIDTPDENDTLSALSYIPETLSSRKLKSKENTLNDELIGSLSDAYENKRARQVTEWERRQQVQRAA